MLAYDLDIVDMYAVYAVYAVSYTLEGTTGGCYVTCHVTVPSARPAAGITKTMECSPLGSVYWEKTSRAEQKIHVVFPV